MGVHDNYFINKLDDDDIDRLFLPSEFVYKKRFKNELVPWREKVAEESSALLIVTANCSDVDLSQTTLRLLVGKDFTKLKNLRIQKVHKRVSLYVKASPYNKKLFGFMNHLNIQEPEEFVKGFLSM